MLLSSLSQMSPEEKEKIKICGGFLHLFIEVNTKYSRKNNEH